MQSDGKLRIGFILMALSAARELAPPWWADERGHRLGTLESRLKRCQAVVFVDLSRGVCLLRVVRRWCTGLFHRPEDHPPDCAPRANRSFLRYVWRYPREHRPRVVRFLDACGADRTIITLRTRQEVRRFTR